MERGGMVGGEKMGENRGCEVINCGMEREGKGSS